jgi:hypothetical protein
MSVAGSTKCVCAPGYTDLDGAEDGSGCVADIYLRR